MIAEYATYRYLRCVVNAIIFYLDGNIVGCYNVCKNRLVARSDSRLIFSTVVLSLQ